MLCYVIRQMDISKSLVVRTETPAQPMQAAHEKEKNNIKKETSKGQQSPAS